MWGDLVFGLSLLVDLWKGGGDGRVKYARCLLGGRELGDGFLIDGGTVDGDLGS